MKSLHQYILAKYNNAHGGDEFYTRIQDIEKELTNYDLRGKTVYCNCDNPKFSNFWKYFHDNFKQLGLKHLIATYYDKNPQRYDFDGNIIKTKAIESGKFQDNADIISECDIVVTNPPFSNGMPSELIELVVDKYKKDLLFVGPLMLAFKKDVFEKYFKNGKIHAGYHAVYRFDRPANKKSENGRATCNWWTNIPVKKPRLETGIKFDKNKAVFDENNEYLICKEYMSIPDNYKKQIATSVNFMNHINYDQFEIIGCGRTKNPVTKFKQVFIKKK